MARVGLFENLKFKKLVKRTGWPRPHAMGYLQTLWQVGWSQLSPVIGTAEDVEIAAEWPGEPGEFFDGICDGWLDELGGGIYAIHDFEDHLPDYVRKRYARDKARKTEHSADTYIIEDGAERRRTAPDGRKRPTHPVRSGPVREIDSSTNVGVVGNSPDSPPPDRSSEEKATAPERQLRRHTNPPAEIDRLVDYQTEVLNKLDGITTVTERTDRGTLLLIARHVPPSIVLSALEATQDARLRAMDGEHSRVNHAKYFVDVVKRRCTSAGIKSPFGAETTCENARDALPSRVSSRIEG